MAEIKVKFVHPTDGGFRPATIDDTMATDELIGLLVSEGFVSGPESDVQLMLKGSNEMLRGDQSLKAGGVREGSILKIVAATNAGNQN